MCSSLNLILVMLSVLDWKIVRSETVTLNKCPSSSLPDEIKLPPSIMKEESEVTFKLQSGKWNCQNGSQELVLVGEAVKDKEDGYAFPFRQMSSNGVFENFKEKYSEYLNPDDYCIQSLAKSVITIRTCDIHCGITTTCISKCCPLGQGLSADLLCSTPNKNDKWSPPLSSKNCSGSDPSCKAENKLHFIVSEPNCEDVHHYSSKDTPFQILKNGSLQFGANITINSDFCVDSLLDHLGDVVANAALVCPQPITSTITLNKCPSSELKEYVKLPPSLMMDNAETTFGLQSGKWKCADGFQEVTLYANAINQTYGNGTGFAFPYKQMSASGFLEAQINVHSEYFNSNQYCIQKYEESKITFQVCKIKCGGDITCVPKCCLWDKGLTNDAKCVSSSKQKWLPPIYHNETHQDCSTSATKDLGSCLGEEWKEQHLHYLQVEPTCGDDAHIHSSAEITFHLLTNGSLLYSNSIVQAEFCMDGLYDDDGVLSSHLMVVCLPEESEEEKDDREFEKNVSITYSIMMFISSAFLLMTIIIYAAIWDKHNLHGYTVFSLSVSMFFMLVFLATSRIMGRNLYLNVPSRTSQCIAVGLFSHLFFLSTFCWLSTLNFDLWWTFRTLSPTIAKHKGLQRFLYYSCFAWGLPTVVVSTAFILDKTVSPNTTSIALPMYGKDGCFIQESAQGPYLYIPIGILLTFNLVFFGTTVYKMYMYQKSTSQARAGKTNGHTQSLQLFVKLFIVMGVTWIFEIISWSFSRKGSLSPAWIIFDFINLLQGILIFFIFVCKRTILSHLWNKYPKARWLLSPLHQLPCCKPTGMDIEGREISGGRTTQSNVSMKTYSRANSLSES